MSFGFSVGDFLIQLATKIRKGFVEAPVQFKSISDDDNDGRSPLYASARIGCEKVARLLLKQGLSAHPKDEKGHTPLFEAAGYGHLNLVQLFLDWDLDINPEDIELNVSLIITTHYSKETIIQFLLDRGADPNNLSGRDLTPLMWASLYGLTSVVQLMLKCGAEWEIKDSQGRTALSCAAARGSTEVIQILLQNGADIKTDYYGFSVFSNAVSHDEYANLTTLLSANKITNRITNIHQPDRYGRTPLHVAAAGGHLQSCLTLLDTGSVELEIKNIYGQTALSCVAACPNPELILLLLENGADINTEDNHGRGVIFYAASENRHSNLTAIFTSTKIRNIHRPDRYGRTPLHVAAARGHLQSVFTLLKIDGVDCEAQDEFGRTALSEAILRKRFDVVELLTTFSKTTPEVLICPVVEPSSFSFCDICGVGKLKGETFYHCDTCCGADFDMCQVCYHIGARGLDRSHELELWPRYTHL
ncbi:hypothetical protein N7463_005867 [Penicillium fimorum]|uniref:ZZ-type domain-containing protein n=1 Tax=Penicillium fimorum TaxID=1882269 RepID=A0A9W9XTD6_9EURO|nr:hypothetical protein N7463_005867 [Penicillium fimorum]